MDWLAFDVVVITLGSLLASFINGAFATGGVYILLASSSAVLPLSAAVPLQSVFAFASLLARIQFFWADINWPIVRAFTIGAVAGVAAGANVFVALPESILAILLGLVLLVLIWLPASVRVPTPRHPFVLIGAIHSFLGTIFGVGAVLQPTILRTGLLKAQITGTLAACLAIMDVFKITGYVSVGFSYADYIPHIIGATIAGFVGTWAGKRVTHRVSEQLFRQVFKTVITLVAFRLLYRGISLL